MELIKHPDLDQVFHACHLIQYCNDALKIFESKIHKESNDKLFIMVGVLDWVTELHRLIYVSNK